MTLYDRMLFLLDPKNDLVFKALLGRKRNQDLLLSLLNAVLALSEEAKILTVQLLTPFSEAQVFGDKMSILDLWVRDARGRQYGIEMQCRNHRAVRERMLYYAARRYGEQLRSGEPYLTLRPVVIIVFTDFVLFPELPGYRHHFKLRDEEAREVFSDHLSVLLVELPKFDKSAAEASGSAEEWIAFLREGASMTAEVMERWVTPELHKAMEELKLLSADEEFREEYEQRLRSVQLRATEIQSSYEDGLQEGIERHTAELVRHMLGEGLDPERVAHLAKLSLSDVLALREN